MEKPGSEGDLDYEFKLVLIGDSGVGKSSLLWSCSCDSFECQRTTIGVDTKIKYITLGGKKLKIVIRDTAGQERFRTITHQYYRGAQGIIMVYDVTQRETLGNLAKIWNGEIDQHKTNQDCVKMLVANKVDMESERAVTEGEGINFARVHRCLYHECSAKTRVNVDHYFEKLVLKILETPSLLIKESDAAKKSKIKVDQTHASTGGCCS